MYLELILPEGVLRGSSKAQPRNGILATLSIFALARSLALVFIVTLFALPSSGQDASAGAIRGSVSDASGARIASAAVTVTHIGTNITHGTATDAAGEFVVQLLTPGGYRVRVEAAGMSPYTYPSVHVEVGGAVELKFKLSLARASENVTVSGAAPMVETQSSEVSHVIDEKSISELPLNGRRFTDLALLTPGVTQDPRGLTASSTGDLSFGGQRGTFGNGRAVPIVNGGKCCFLQG